MSNCGTGQGEAQVLGEKLEEFVRELLVMLDKRLDSRLVRTFLLTLQAILKFRHQTQGLVLSELGGYILSPAQAPAGTKRLSNLLRSSRWGQWMIGRFLWQRASQHIEAEQRRGETTLVLWDESVIEKPESIALEGLCAVRSSRARRLKRIKKGYYNPPGGAPICVPGMHWLSLVVVGMSGVPRLAAMRWWTTRGKFATQARPTAVQLLHLAAYFWQQKVIHIWDRGFAHSPWLGEIFRFKVRFILRWKTKQKLVDAKGKRNAWKITRGKRSLDHCYIRDVRRQCWRKTGIYFTPVTHPDYPHQPLWLVVSRPGQGQTPWYLLTNEPLQTCSDAWHIVFAYARRWQIEMSYRFTKSELAIESPRLWSWHNRLKLMMMVALVYAFLLSLMDSQLEVLRLWLFRNWGHRTDQRLRHVKLPLYRLRAALARLWLSHPPSFRFAWKNSG
ncbi:MAG: transposase [Anaerolineae bacterium]|nr:transposase [Anaerolineae bacterium]